MTALPAPPGFDFRSLLLVGAGRMGGAMLEGWLALGLDGRRITIIEPHPGPEMPGLCDARGITLNPPGSPPVADVLVLAVKPQMLDAAVPRIASAVGTGTIVLSIIAGKTVADLAARLSQARVIVRAMPNTPAAVGRGVTGVVAGTVLSDRQHDLVDHLLTAVGRVEWLPDESLIDAVTAVSGSGPAYVFYLTESLAKAGEAAGLGSDLAARLARATVEGAAELMFRSPDVPPSVLRRNVTSPAGTTAAGLDVLMDHAGLDPLMERTVAAAKRRAGNCLAEVAPGPDHYGAALDMGRSTTREPVHGGGLLDLCAFEPDLRNALLSPGLSPRPWAATMAAWTSRRLGLDRSYEMETRDDL